MKYWILFVMMLSAPVVAQTCLSSAVATSPDANYVNNGDGTISDVSTGLMWMQCSIGQTWVAGTCTGDASELTWQQALQFAHGYQYANLSGWRVPNIKELASITELKCVRPSINETFFPSTLSDDYWTSTPSPIDLERAWVVAFFNSSNSLKDKNLFVFTRLVRTVD